MDPAESATIPALPGVGMADVAGDGARKVIEDELTGAARRRDFENRVSKTVSCDAQRV